jgi:hypothetical protein
MTLQGAPRALADSRAEALALVEEAAEAIEAGRGGTAELAIIVSSLDGIWGSVERNPGLRAAALDVFEAAAALRRPQDTSAKLRLRRMLRDGIGRLRERVEAARPSSESAPPKIELPRALAVKIRGWHDLAADPVVNSGHLTVREP